MKKLSILLTLMALVFIGLGCKSPTQVLQEKAVEQASGGKIQVDGSDFTITTDQGTVTSEQKIPNNFPKYIPIYQNSKFITATTLNTSSIYVSFESTDDVNTLFNWYKNALKDWKITSEANYGLMGLLAVEKGTEKINISFTGEEGKDTFDASGKKITTGEKTTFVINWSK